jgi:hypothetical protein
MHSQQALDCPDHGGLQVTVPCSGSPALDILDGFISSNYRESLDSGGFLPHFIDSLARAASDAVHPGKHFSHLQNWDLFASCTTASC